MITQKENGSTSPKSQPAQDSANFTDTPERLQSSIAAITERCRAKFKPQNIPADLKAVKGWVVWKAKEKAKSQPGKFDKVPFYPSGSVRKGTQGDGRDRARLGTFEQALAAFNESPGYAGLGLAMLPDWGLTAFDGDGCMNDQGEIDVDVDELTQGTYTEVSPSGRGVRAFYRGTHPTARNGNREIYSKTQFVTVTGDAIDDTRTLLDLEEVRHMLGKMFAKPDAVKSSPAPANASVSGPLLADLRSALEFIGPDPYDVWTDTGMALKTAPLDPLVKNELYHEWSARSDKYDYAECQAKWESYKPTKTSYKAIFARAQVLGWVIREICAGDDSLVRFHQMSLGAMLSGAKEEHWLIYWFGTGRNGKNLLADLVFSILGEYAHKLPSSALMSKKHEAHPTELTGLRGVRLALSSEIEEGAFWNEARLKELTGDEYITARYMGRDAFTFTKSHKHLILGNHRPQIKTVDDAIKNRVLLVPFDVSFAGREDRDLPQKIRAEAGFVLHWLIEGHTAWMENGKRLPKCEAVERATKGYFAAQSTIEMWIDERCRKVDDPDRPANGWCTASELYDDYQQWKRARGEAPVSQTRFGEFMARAFVKAQSKKAAVYVGLELDRAGVFPVRQHWTT